MKHKLSPNNLQNSDAFTLIQVLPFSEIKPFILKSLSNKTIYLKLFTIYQTLSLTSFLGLICYIIFKAIISPLEYLPYLYAIAMAIVFSVTLLIILHELIHALSYLLMGKRHLHFGFNRKHFIFYVHAHQQVVNRNQFITIALAPFVGLHIICLSAILLSHNIPSVIFFLSLLLIHALFCGGDMAIINYLLYQDSKFLYTYDDSETKTAYFYKKRPTL